MPIIVNLDVMMAKRKVGAGELAKAIGITPANLSAGRYPGICSGRRE